MKTIFKKQNYFGEDGSAEFYKTLAEANHSADIEYENLTARDKARNRIHVEPVMWDTEGKMFVGIDADSDYNIRLLASCYDSDAPEVKVEFCGDELAIYARGVRTEVSKIWIWEEMEEARKKDEEEEQAEKIIDSIIDDVEENLREAAEEAPEILNAGLFGAEKQKIIEELETIVNYL